MRRRLRALRRCIKSPADAWLAIRMAAWTPFLPVLKRVVPLPRLVRLMSSEAARTGREQELEWRIGEIARLLYRSRAVTRRDNCLERSLLAYRFLARANAAPDLFVGMTRDGDELRGHVWVSVDGEPLHETDESLAAYTRILVFDSGGTQVDVPRPRPGPREGAHGGA